MNALKVKDKILKKDLIEVFKGYHAHHIISANNLWDKEGMFYKLLKKCADENMDLATLKNQMGL